MADLDSRVGKDLTPEEFSSVLAKGNIQFPFKPTTVSAVSQPGDERDVRTDDVDAMIDSVVGNEEMVKLLEDMRDDMLQGMNIPPANDGIADAAKQLGSPDGSINKQVFDTAETILDPIIMEANLQGYSSIIAALTGNGKIDGDFLDCNEVTKAIADSWNVNADKEGALTVDQLHKQGSGQAVQDARDTFAKKMAAMMAYIFAMMWWEKIWSRLVIFTLDSIEKLIAIPIDTPFLILRFFKKLTKKNYYKFGPVHKVLNRWKIYLLCTVPRKAFKPYKPDPAVRVWNQKKKEIVSLQSFCANEKDVEECPGLEPGFPPGVNEDGNVPGWPKDPDDLQDATAQQLDKSFPVSQQVDECISARFSKLFPEQKFPGPGMSPACMEAAKKIMDAVYDDAMRFGEYEGTQLQAEQSLQAIIQGDITSLQGDA
jgi:hypothetical protein